jgi:hypothetical protein
MGKGKAMRGRKRQQSYSGNKGDSVVLRGHCPVAYLTTADPSGSVFVGIHPLSLAGTYVATRLQDLCAIYQFYRYKRLEAVFCAGGSNATPSIEASGILIAVCPTGGTSKPLSTASLIEMDHVAYSLAGQSTVVRFKCPPHLLKGEKPYYDTDTIADSPCALWVACIDAVFKGVAGLAGFVWNYEIEFYGRSPTTVTLNKIVARAPPREKDEDEKDYGVIAIPPCQSCKH